jgi:hypothetical protein
MTGVSREWYSGKICLLNEEEVNFRAEIYIDKYYQGIVTIYDVTNEVYLAANNDDYKSAVMMLDNRDYISLFNLYIKSGSSNSKIVDDEPVFDGNNITVASSVIIKGHRGYSTEDNFKVLYMEITDGCELIGLCPYNLNKNYVDIMMCKNIEISVKINQVQVNTSVGKLCFTVYPNYIQSAATFVLGFRHRIEFIPKEPLKVTEVREELYLITSFFSLLCGESVTVNRLSLMEMEDSNSVEYIGLCNFPKEKLKSLNNSGIDTTRYKRLSIFKISDFPNLEKTMDYWFNYYKALSNAQQAYGRILLDEEQGLVTTNKFLAAMQLIEGYTQAYIDEAQEVKDFEKKKKDILSKLTEQDDIDLIENGLGFSSVSFRKAVKEYLYKGICCLKPISKTAFSKKSNKLLDSIVNDRNYYTHSSNRTSAQLSFNEMLNVASICKEVYRVLILAEMGISQSLLVQRLSYNRLATALFDDLLKIHLSADEGLTEYDSAMWHFSNPK